MKAFISTILLSINLFAHPHFFIDVNVTIADDKITYYWSFDRLNSKLLSFEFDTNKDKVFQKSEKQKFYNTHIVKTKEYNYNLFLEVNTINYTFEELKNYELALTNGHVVFSFSQKLEKLKQATVCNIDPTLYMAFNLKEIDTKFKLDIQKSQYDFCIGVK